MATIAEEYEAEIETTLVAPPEPPPSVTSGTYSMVREPTPDEVSSWTSLQQIATWAKLNGELTWSPSKAGSLVRLCTDEDEVANLEISEFASLSQKQFEKLLKL